MYLLGFIIMPVLPPEFIETTSALITGIANKTKKNSDRKSADLILNSNENTNINLS